MLLQGLELPYVRPCSTSQLPPSMVHPSSPLPPPLEPFLFEEPEDTYGQTLVQTGSTNSTRTIISTSATDSTTQDYSRATQDYSRATQNYSRATQDYSRATQNSSRDVITTSRDVITASFPELLSSCNMGTTSSTSLPLSETASSSTPAPVSRTTLWQWQKEPQ